MTPVDDQVGHGELSRSRTTGSPCGANIVDVRGAIRLVRLFTSRPRLPDPVVAPGTGRQRSCGSSMQRSSTCSDGRPVHHFVGRRPMVVGVALKESRYAISSGWTVASKLQESRGSAMGFNATGPEFNKTILVVDDEAIEQTKASLVLRLHGD